MPSQTERSKQRLGAVSHSFILNSRDVSNLLHDIISLFLKAIGDMEQTIRDFAIIGRKVILIEAKAVSSLSSRINKEFNEACQLCLDCQGRIIVTGMGKSGHIGRKIAATFASTGTPAHFVHAAEAAHGDMGMITEKDVVIAISNSGESKEFITLLPLIKRLGVPLISMTGNPQSTIAVRANANLDISVEEEACALGLAPTSSTTATLAMGDAMAIALLEAKGFSKEDFAFSHPGGSLGKRLLLKIEDIMLTGDKIPTVAAHASLKEALLEMTSKRLGMTAVIDHNRKYLGLFTDGDLRRTLDKNLNLSSIVIEDIMTKGGTTVKANLLAAEALRIMQQKKINGMFVLNAENEIIGAFNMHDLLSAGIL